MIKKNAITDIGFVLSVAAICHLLFSQYGFNPTDEGFVLSATNRVLHGQIPHVDFSSVRPVGYAYLHIPELLFSKNYFFQISRFVFWLEQILIAYLWFRFLLKYLKASISMLEEYGFVFSCFIFNVHYFPTSVLHTIDGLLMCMIGLNLVIASKKKWNFIGFFFIGFAALCKQNYLVILPFVLFLFGRKNFILNLIAGIFPIAFYIGFISFHGGLNDLITQLGGHNELIKVGLLAYMLNPCFLITFILVFLLRYKHWHKMSLFILWILIIVLLVTNHYHGKYSFIIIAYIFAELVIGLLKKYHLLNFIKDEVPLDLSNAIFRDIKIYDENNKQVTDFNDSYNYSIYNDEDIVLSFITLLIAWSVSISVGYNTPALFIGGCMTWCIINYNKHFVSQKNESPKSHTISNIIVVLLLASLLIYVRTTNIYRDAKAKDLTYQLDGIVDGACGIRTNLNTYKVLVELNLLKKKYPDIIVVPDFTACNILHSHKSKILTEWPNKTEIPNNKILQKVTSKIEKDDTTLVFATPIYQTALLKDSFTHYNPRYGTEYKIVYYLVDNFGAVDNTNYFIVFKK